MSKRMIYQDKIRGSMIGGAIGDALGYAIEFDSFTEIQKKYGPDGLTCYAPDRDTGKALISDDTQMTLFTANGILLNETRLQIISRIPGVVLFVHRAYLDWLTTQGFEEKAAPVSWIKDIPKLCRNRAPGNTCLSALLSGRMGTIERPVNNSKGCGGIMRIAPVALYDGKLPIETIDLQAAEIAAITHGHPLGYMSAAVAAHLIYRGVFGGCRDIKDALSESLATVKKLFENDPYLPKLEKIVRFSAALSENDAKDIDNIRKIGEGWVAEETLAIAVYCCLRYQNDFSKAVIAAVNHNGDSDSTGAVTGNILGAWQGSSAIDKQWINGLELKDLILEIADDLCFGAQISLMDLSRSPVWEDKYCRCKYDKIF